jgi:hypothetical protein
MRGGGNGGILDALPIPLGSTVTLFKPPGLAGPGGIPLIATFPVPASPAIRANEVVGAAMSSFANPEAVSRNRSPAARLAGLSRRRRWRGLPHELAVGGLARWAIFRAVAGKRDRRTGGASLDW